MKGRPNKPFMIRVVEQNEPMSQFGAAKRDGRKVRDEGRDDTAVSGNVARGILVLAGIVKGACLEAT